ncbi:MAG TPA: septum formation initiator family protein [Solirubrobacteraceae bacterium]|nr:septum formation initiator family protein [Solirubrobacteraceae bacterium]
MPAASATQARPRPRPRRRADPVGRVRWDRLARLALLAVLVALVYLYMSAGVRMFSTWRQSRHDNASVAALTAEHARLVRQHQELSGQAALEAQARKLGMMRRDEQPYVVSGLPQN